MDNISISIKNFKSLKEIGPIDIKPITLLFGPNNSGKSSFIQTLLILKNSMENQETNTPISLNNVFVKLGSFKDVIYKHIDTKNFEFKIKINSLEGNANLIYKTGLIDKLLNLKEFIFEFNGNTITVNNNEAIIKIHNGDKYSIKSDYFRLNNYRCESLFNPQIDLESFNLNYYGLKEIENQIAFWEDNLDDQFPVNQVRGSILDLERSKSSIIKELEKIKEFYNLKDIKDNNIQFIVYALKSMNLFNEKLKIYFQSISNIGPLRIPFTSHYLLYDDRYNTIGNKGENFLSIVIDILADKEKSEMFKTWLNKINAGSDILMNKFEEIHTILLLNPILKSEMKLPNVYCPT